MQSSGIITIQYHRNLLRYPVNSDLSIGYCCPPFEQLGAFFGLSTLGISFNSKELVPVIEFTFVVNIGPSPQSERPCTFPDMVCDWRRKQTHTIHVALVTTDATGRVDTSTNRGLEEPHNRMAFLNHNFDCIDSSFLSLTLHSTTKVVDLPPPLREPDDNKSDRRFPCATTRELRSRVSLNCKREGKLVTYWSNFL